MLYESVIGIDQILEAELDASEEVNDLAGKAKEADDLMEEQHDVIKAFYVWATEEDRDEAAGLIAEILTKYQNWKDQTK